MTVTCVYVQPTARVRTYVQTEYPVRRRTNGQRGKTTTWRYDYDGRCDAVRSRYGAMRGMLRGVIM